MAWDFIDSTSYLAVATSTIDFDSAYTVSLWFKLDSLPTTSQFYFLWSLEDGLFDADALRINDAGKLVFTTINGGTVDDNVGSATLSTGVWYHVVMSKEDLAVGGVWLDGTQDISINEIAPRTETGAVLYFGIYAGAAFALDGQIDAVKIYGFQITENQVRQERYSRLPRSGTPLHWFEAPPLSSDKLVNRGSAAQNLSEVGTVNLADGAPIGYDYEDSSFLQRERVKRDAVYGFAKEGYLGGPLDWDLDNMKALAVTDGYVPNFSTDNHIDEIPRGSRLQTSELLTSKTKTLGKADCATVTFRNVNQKIEAVVIYLDTGDETTSRLVCYINTAANLPTHPHGRDATVSWPTEIFQL